MELRIALAGNPNSGKTTLFNALTGSNQYVGNWPGVTVEKKEGKLKGYDNVTITDLPGIYSLSPYTLEEVVAREYLIKERPNAILNIVDGTNLERNLYLTTQLTELGIPVVVAINMMDLVDKKGDEIDLELLEKQMGVKFVSISALKGTNIDKAAAAAVEAAKNGKTIPMHTFAGNVEHALAHIEEACVHNLPEEQQRWYSIKLFERDDKVMEALKLDKKTLDHINKDIEAVEKEMDDDSESIITNERYIYIGELLKGIYKKKSTQGLTTSDKIDKIVTNRILGLPIFAAIMTFVYWLAMGPFGTFLTDWTNDVFAGWLTEGAAGIMESLGVSDWLVSLVADGIVGGVGAVLGFVPQMLVLFLMLCILEDVGYMARVAFIMDRIFRKFGLSGKSFIPMLIGSGCGVPAVMATRTIENERDRRMTIMTTCFIPCGAKLPIIGLIAGAIFNNAWWVSASAYFIGVASIIISGIILKKTKLFAGDPAPFVMELPPYHVPSLSNVLRGTWERGWSFIKRAGTVIVLSSVVIWVLNSLSFEGGLHYLGEDGEGASILENIGSLFAWIFAPLGFGTWQATVATILGLVAKEDVVGTIGTLISMEDLPDLVDAGENIAGVLDVFFNGSAVAGFAFMVFNLLCAPCFAAMGAIKREMNNAKWTAIAIGYMCVFAYAVALCIYQIGSALNGQVHVLGLICAIAIIAFAVYMLFKPYKESEKLTQTVKVD
ncbi:MAG: ferrous iron transport protein B [Erysipelotrichaceae bacterium]|nr:ferrous iron transport protein B [Erysipelotrichaceae bacterium]MBQ2655019.1 ferrous iron transport protein B [Erysipelotrichaceae bacterium]MBR4483722.1 ferrous iron transport protein B [Erysipelotrichaceae bacterium]MBR4609416.1 ferrous iron transport protein B [Erysipelotrichaceae bacterium]MBR6261506.1 ferrous iron transport protein B [Erysipelotrichaceae bacterium]